MGKESIHLNASPKLNFQIIVKVSTMSMLPYDSKVCRMMLTSRMVLDEEQQKFVCEGKKV